MPVRVLLSTLTALLLLAVSADVIRAQEKVPDGVFTFTPSHDELKWSPIPFAPFDQAKLYIGTNGYSVELFRMPPNADAQTHTNRRRNIDNVIRVLSGTLHLALSDDDISGLTRADAKSYGPGSFIVQPHGVYWRWFSGDDGVTFELTHVRNITRRTSE